MTSLATRLETAELSAHFELPDGFAERLAAALASGQSPAAAPGYVYERDLGRTTRRRGGIYYTPEPIAEYTASSVIDPLLAGKSTDEVLQLRVADLACGGGVFVIVALERMRAHCVRADPAGVSELGGDAALRAALAGCVLAVDIDPCAAEVCRLALALWIGGEHGPGLARPAVLEADALLDDLPDQLSAVIGNPPWGQKGFVHSKDQRAALRRRFRCGDGPLDPFKLFIERAHELLDDGGRWGLVVPDILLLKSYESTRRLILAGSELDRFVHLGREFPGVNIDTLIVVGTRRRSPAPGNVVDIHHDLGCQPARRQRQDVFGELPAARFNLYLDDRSLALYRRLRQLPRLGERFEIHEGVHSGNVRHKLFCEQRPAGPCAPLILGRGELEPFKLRWEGRWIDLEPGLVDRPAGEYANLGRSRWHLSDKLVVRRTGDRIVAACDLDGHYVSNNMFVLLPRHTGTSLMAHLGLLQSSLYTWFFRTEQPRVGRLFAELKIVHLRDFPLPPSSAWDGGRDELADLAGALSAGERDGRSARRRLDTLVCELFDLGAAERQLVDSMAAGTPG